MPEGEIILCMRLQGHSASICGCRIADSGWLPCPEIAQGMLTPTYPPAAYDKPKIYKAAARDAKAAGYTGSICDLCGSPRMRRSGTCETCDDCGAAGGCG